MRPCKLMPGIPSPLANRKPGDIDFVVVRENTEGEYSSVGGRMYEGTEREIVFQESVFSRKGVDRVMRFAFDLARTRPAKHVTSATKSNGISITMPYWDERFRVMGAEFPDMRTDQFHIDILSRALRAAARNASTSWSAPTCSATSCRTWARGVRHDRHRPVGEHEPRAHVPVAVRAGARLRARHRGQGHRQSRSARSGRAR